MIYFLQKVSMTNTGVLSMGNFTVDNLHESQYIAPFIAYFEYWEMYYFDDAYRASFTWLNMLLKGSEIHFNFQVNLFSSGKIQIIYKNVPQVGKYFLIEMVLQVAHDQIGL